MIRVSQRLLGLGLAMGLVSRPASGADLKDLYFGEALYHAYQGQYFDALQRLDTELAQYHGLDEPVLDTLHFHVNDAEFSVGEDRKVMVLSVTEGEDKPLKYPLMFRVSDLLLLNKTDLLEHLDFDLPDFRANAARANPRLPIIELSARTGQGFEAWIDWLLREVAATATGRARCGGI